MALKVGGFFQDFNFFNFFLKTLVILKDNRTFEGTKVNYGQHYITSIR